LIIIEPDSKKLKDLLENLGNFADIELSDDLELRKIEIKKNEIVLLVSGDDRNIEPVVKWLSKYFGVNVKLMNFVDQIPSSSIDSFALSPAAKVVKFWENICREINGSIPYFNRSFRPKIKDDNTIILEVPNEFLKDRFEMKKNVFLQKVEQITSEKINLAFEVVEDNSSKISTNHQDYEEHSNNSSFENQIETVKEPKKEETKQSLTETTDSEEPCIPQDLTPGNLVMIRGEIFQIEKFKDTYYVSITDMKDSVTCTVREKMFDDLDLDIGSEVKVSGTVFYDSYRKEALIRASKISKISLKKRIDLSTEKRIELHLHTKMSTMDAIVDIDELIKTLKAWNHDAVAVTDHGVTQAFPELYEKAIKNGIKPIFGMEGYLIDDVASIINNLEKDSELDEVSYVVFDLETTGLDPSVNEIIEIGAVKIERGKIIEEFHTLIKPKGNISEASSEITGITMDMLFDKPFLEEVLPEFLDFVGDSVLVAHNANFDYRFIRYWIKKLTGEKWKHCYIDTLALSKALLEMRSYTLDKVAEKLNLGSFKHHRALDDAKITAEIFLKFLKKLKLRGINTLSQIDSVRSNVSIKKSTRSHVTILVKNKQGLKNLYEIVSKSHLDYFYSVPRIPKSLLASKKEGLLLGTACVSGELAQNYLAGATISELEDIITLYDFIEIMPLDVVEESDNRVNRERLKQMYKDFYRLAKRLNMPVVMTGDVHFLNPEDAKVREVLMAAQGRRDYQQPALYLRTTEEMLQAAFEIFEDEKKAREVVIENPRKLVQQIEDIKLLEKKLHPPIIEGAEKIVKEKAVKKAKEMYGDPLPEIVESRLKKELDEIIGNGYAVLYLIAQKLVEKSNSDGYVVGSRGSVGSSLVATMLGITEVNPLPPHYYCPNCNYTEFFADGSYGSGYDLPKKNCPKCGKPLKSDGQDIPFEVFMGFKGEKVPDIDLNFSGEYQSTAHKFIEELFGKDHVFRAGTISTIASRTAYGFVKKYEEVSGKALKATEVDRLVSKITGVKRTTGQHPGGLMIVPKNMEIYDFTPVQYPANDRNSGTITTHFDYNSIHDDLVKLDALGHDDPTFIKMLKDLTGIDPMTIDMSDKETLSIFSSTKALGVKPQAINSKVGTFGIPEFGTQFVRQMLEETKPSTFADLVRISGLSHGTDVWLNNARDIIMSKQATLKDVIACRADIMNYLIQKGLDELLAFKIMENVRKGKGLTEEMEKEMKEHKVPRWFINSCKKIKYLFPKAHAVAYVSMAFRIAYFKVHYPLEFYSAYFTIKGDEFDMITVLKGKKAIKERLAQLSAVPSKNVKEKAEETNLYLALEMMERGYEFLPVDLMRSDYKVFKIEGNALRIPLSKIPGLGEKLASAIVSARKNKPFSSIEDLCKRSGVTKANVEVMKSLNILSGLPETEQISLF